MNKQILIVFEPSSQVHLVSSLISHMRNKGLSIDAFNTNKWQYIGTDKEIPFFYRLIRKTLFVPQLGRVTRKLFQTSLLCKISIPYDLVDLHYFWRTFIPFIMKLKKPYKLTIWGSDFYRELPMIQEKKKRLYEKASIIQVETEDVKRDVCCYHPVLSDKIYVCNFGTDILQLMSHYNDVTICKGKRIVVTIGYNGSRGQQHLLLINAIKMLSAKHKDQIQIYVPATYGLTPDYYEEINKELNNIGIPYTIFRERLSEADLAKLRFESNIVLNAQETDSMSASLIQHLYAGGVLIVGDWLPYGIYDRNNLFYLKTSKESFTERLSYAIDHFSALRERAMANREKILSFATWEAVSDMQFLIYKQALNY